MKDLILDTSALIVNPAILSRRFDGYRLVIPNIVLRELQNIAVRKKDLHGLLDLIQQAQQEGLVSIESVPMDSLADRHAIAHGYDATDMVLLDWLGFLKSQGRDFILVTRDFDLLEAAKRFGFPTAGQLELSQLAKRHSKVEKDIESQATQVRRKQVSSLVLNFGVGIACSIVASITTARWNAIAPYISRVPTIAAFSVMAFALFALRARWRFAYGLFEFLFGLYIGFRAFSPDFSLSALNEVRSVQALGSLYVMVRGLDNVQKAAKTTIVGPWLERLAPLS